MAKSETLRTEQALTPIQFQLIAKSISDPTRYEVLKYIHRTSAVTPSVLAKGLRVSPATISHHLNGLRNASLIDSTRNGRYQYLRPARSGFLSAFLAELEVLNGSDIDEAKEMKRR
jgi:DNA-binding transcriptional ArsR family regulator